MKTAVLIMAYGTPSSMNDMAAYLSDIREGRTPSQELVEEMQHRYTLIGKSPLNEITQAQAKAIESTLARKGHDLSVYIGMRHWTPWIKDTVAQMNKDGVTHAVGLVMAPHYSSLSIGKYQKRVEEAQSGISFTFIQSWWQQPKFLQALEDKIIAALNKIPSNAKTKLVFTAHSLPTRILKMGDPYDQQLKQNAEVMAKRLEKNPHLLSSPFEGEERGEGLSNIDWTFAYQSAGASPEPWLGPSLEETIPTLAEQGYSHVLAAPIGFVCDHVEILFDLDIEAKQIAETHRIQLLRTESMNTTPLFIEAIADAIEEKL